MQDIPLATGIVCGYAVKNKAYFPTSSPLVLLSVEKQGEEITTGNCFRSNVL